MLATARDGSIDGEAGQGLFVCQTRVISIYRYSVDGKAPIPAGVSNIEQDSQLAYLIAKAPLHPGDPSQAALGHSGPASEDAIELQFARLVGDGLREEVELVNHTQAPAHFVLELHVDADFADTDEAQDGHRKQEGRLENEWLPGHPTSQLRFCYQASHVYDHQGHSGRATLHREAVLRFSCGGPAPSYDREKNRVRWEVRLDPHATSRMTVDISAVIEGRVYGLRPAFRQARAVALRSAARPVSGSPQLTAVVNQALERSRRDLVGLRIFDLGSDSGWTISAGLPSYTALFGRDTLTAAWQASLLGPELMLGTLSAIAGKEAKTTDDWRDEQPGRLIHQVDTGPLSVLMYNPLGRYYGTLTCPAFFPVVLSNLWHWTGNLDLVREYIDVARRGLAWLDRDAKRESGFYAYQTRSEQGIKNQSWKDSSDAIVYPDGSQVQDPISPCEAQAYVYAAKVRMSELLWWLGEKEASRLFFDEAIALRKRFNEVFWMPEENCFGMGLDPKGRLIRSVGSESAHAIAAGIVRPDRAAQTIERLFQPDLFSGWGLRTLSARHRAYNPFSYHRGSIWPAEQAAFSMGLMRYDCRHRLHQLTRAQFDAAGIFEYCRLPEVFSGHSRDRGHPIPALYPRANSPQAWSASAVPCMIQAMLGMFPYAPLKLLFLDPHLPDYLPELRIENIRVGEASVDLSFRRTREGKTSYKVEQIRGKLRVIRQPSPWSLTTTFGQRLVDGLSSFLPGR